ncbi:porin family protein [Bradyrhizobium sediminis]|uniref:Porin family protein n=2 Tax=Bradyrhizobium sediminis TaxID=2840469 RepID=A0A975P3X2_9BRAD|nr:porin family protein [Bradyrhizobium sediminis]
MAVIPAASAADLAPRYTKAPPVMVEVWNWTGFYIGGNAGYSWGRSNSDVSYFNTATGLPIVPPAGSITSAAFDMDGGIAGGQAGYNWQTGSWVWGVEADIQWSGEKGRANYLCSAAVGGPCTPGLTAPPLSVVGTSLALDQSLEWFGTARLRGGFLVSPRVLLYATGGLAYGSLKTSGTLSGVTANLTPVSVFGSSSETRLGWTVGAGVEGKITQNWSAKLEYLYMDLGRYDSLTLSLAPVVPIGARVSSHFTDHILRAGINYQFGGPVIAKY